MRRFPHFPAIPCYLLTLLLLCVSARSALSQAGYGATTNYPFRHYYPAGQRAAEGKWEAAATEFGKAAYALGTRVKDGREGYQETGGGKTFRIFAHLGRGNALLQQAKATNPPDPELLKSAISELGCSLIENPTLPALSLLADAYQSAGRDKDLSGLLTGGEFTFADAEWAGDLATTKPAGSPRSTRPFFSVDGKEVALQYTYAEFGREVKASLRHKLSRSLRGAQPLEESDRKASPQETARTVFALGTAAEVNQKRLEGGEFCLWKWPEVFNSVSLFVDLVPRPTTQVQDVVNIRPQILDESKDDQLEVKSWRITANGKLVKAASGTEIKADWDTLEDEVKDGSETKLDLVIEYVLNGRMGRYAKEWSVALANPPQRLYPEFEGDQSEPKLVVRTVRRLQSKSCQVGMEANGGGGVTPLPAIDLVEEGSLEKLREDKLGLWRFRYVGRIASEKLTTFDGKLRLLKQEPEFTDRFVSAFPSKDYNPFLVTRLALVRGVVGIGQNAVIQLETRGQTAMPLDLVIQAGGQERMRTKIMPMSSPFAGEYNFEIKPDMPSGTARVTTELNGRVLADAVFQIRTESLSLGTPTHSPNPARVDSPVTVTFPFNRPLQGLPSCTLTGPDNKPTKLTCSWLRGGVYEREFIPSQPGKYVLVLDNVEDDTGVRLPKETLTYSLDVQQDQQARLRIFTPRVLSAGRNLIDVFLEGASNEKPANLRLFADDVELTEEKGPRANGSIYRAVYVAMRGDARPTLRLKASATGVVADQADVPLDAVPPGLRFLDYPASLEKADDQFQIRFRADEPLRGDRPPEVFLEQTGQPAIQALVKKDEGRQNEWVATMGVLAIPGLARIRVAGFDLAGNHGEASIGIPVVGTEAFEVDTPPRWKDGPNRISVYSPQGKPASTPTIELFDSDNKLVDKVLLNPVGNDGRNFSKDYEPASTPKKPYILRLKLNGQFVRSVWVDPGGYTLRKPSYRYLGTPDAWKLQITIEEPRPLQSVTITSADGTVTRLTPSVQDEAHSVWEGQVGVKLPLGNFKYKVVDSLERSVEGNLTPPPPPQAAAGAWALGASPTLVGRLKPVTFMAEGPGVANVSSAAVRIQIGEQELPQESLKRSGNKLVGQWMVPPSLSNGTVTFTLLIDGDEQPAETHVQIKTEGAHLVVDPRPAQKGAAETKLKVGTQPAEPIRAIRLASVFDQSNQPVSGFNLAPSGGDAVSQELSLSLPPDLQAGSYRIVVAAEDVVGNLSNAEGTLFVGDASGSQLKLSIVTPVNGQRGSRLPMVTCRLDCEEAQRPTYRVRVTVLKDNSLLAETTLSPPVPTAGGKTGTGFTASVGFPNKVNPESPAAPSGSGANQVAYNSLPKEGLGGDLNQLLSTQQFGPGTYQIQVQLLQNGLPVNGPNSAAKTEFILERLNIPASQRHAIIVAVRNYGKPEFELPLAYEDAAKWQKLFQEQGYGKISVITDSPNGAPTGAVSTTAAADANSLDDEIKKQLKLAHENNVRYLAFVFIGHGASINGVDVLLPSSFELKDVRSYLGVKNQLGLLVKPGFDRDKKPHLIENVLAIFDACRNPLNSNYVFEGVALPELEQGQNLVVATASGPSKFAVGQLEPDKNDQRLAFRGSVFTQKFVESVGVGGSGTWSRLKNLLQKVVNETAAEIARSDSKLRLPEGYKQDPKINFSDPDLVNAPVSEFFPGR